MGIEGLSRGCREAHFVELDPRVARAVLEPNLAACDVTRAASVHVMVRVAPALTQPTCMNASGAATLCSC